MTEPALGFRRWAVTYDGRTHEAFLRGRVAPAIWAIDGWTDAQCVPAAAPEGAEPHDAPDRDCECGLYAYHSLEPALARIHNEPQLLGMYWDNSEDREVIGAVIGAGRVVVHGIGWRAQHARPVVLAAPEARFSAVADIAGRMGIPTVSLGQLARFATEFGGRLRPP